MPRMQLSIMLDCSAEISRLSIFTLHVLFMESRTNISNVCLFNTSKCIRDFSKLHKAPILTLKAQTGHSKKNQQKKLHAVRIELGTSTIPVWRSLLWANLVSVSSILNEGRSSFYCWSFLPVLCKLQYQHRERCVIMRKTWLRFVRELPPRHGRVYATTSIRGVVVVIYTSVHQGQIKFRPM